MKALVALVALTLAGCATIAPPPIGPTASFGGTATIDGVSIRPLSIVEDSRCPTDVVCVWAGRLIILAEVEFRGGSESWRGPLTLGEPYSHGSETVTLVSASPGKLAAAPVRPSDYRFTFAVARSL